MRASHAVKTPERSVKSAPELLGMAVTFVADRPDRIHAAKFDSKGRKITQHHYSEAPRAS